MKTFDRLEAKVGELVERFDQISQERSKLESECSQLRDRVKSLEVELKRLGDDNLRLEKAINSNNEMALKRVSRLVDKIDQFQTSFKIS
jgi:predicted nuclease with TOPRIM domain